MTNNDMWDAVASDLNRAAQAEVQAEARRRAARVAEYREQMRAWADARRHALAESAVFIEMDDHGAIRSATPTGAAVPYLRSLERTHVHRMLGGF